MILVHRCSEDLFVLLLDLFVLLQDLFVLLLDLKLMLKLAHSNLTVELVNYTQCLPKLFLCVQTFVVLLIQKPVLALALLNKLLALVASGVHLVFLICKDLLILLGGVYEALWMHLLELAHAVVSDTPDLAECLGVGSWPSSLG